MIGNILELVLGNTFEVTILLVFGLLFGIFISLLYWRKQISIREGHIKKNDTDMKNLRVQTQELMNQQKKKIENLNAQINDYKMVLEEREKGIDIYTVQLNDYEKLLNEREKRVEFLNTQLSQRDENMLILTQQIGKKDESIDLLKMEVADLENKNRNSMTNVKSAEDRVGELEKSLEEKEREVASFKTRMRVMQDDFTYILGIGPKVASVLSLAGINTFVKLASSEVSKIKEILKAENPSLLQLTDPSIWPEQARLASNGDWDGLSVLQNSLKGVKRN